VTQVANGVATVKIEKGMGVLCSGSRLAAKILTEKPKA
jgi:hypothetical protein